MIRLVAGSAAALATLALAGAFEPAPASASTPCNLIGSESGIAGKACDLLGKPGKALSAAKNILTGHLGKALNALTGAGGSSVASSATTGIALAAIVAWAVGGAKLALHETAKVLTETTRPELGTTWFSAGYWRMAGIGALLTLPFLFAAAAQALMRSDLTLLARAALGYLPLAMLAISVAAPLTMLLLAATDQLCGLVSSSGAGGGVGILRTSGIAAILVGAAGAPFVSFVIAVITTGAALVLWLELAIREAAVYVIVLMLPLAFAALVWPARRIWALRAVELLVALIVSKFAIVAVLGLGGAALAHSHGLTAALAGTVLVLLGAFAPWAVLRLLPLSELAASAAGSLAPQLAQAVPGAEAERANQRLHHTIAAAMRRHADDAAQPNGTPREGARGEIEALADGQEAGPGAAANGRPLEGDADLMPADKAADTSAEAPTVAPTETPAADNAAAHERLPGLGPKMQQEDLSMEPMPLGAEGFERGEWAGPRTEIWPEGKREEPGEDRDPLPPTQSDESL